MTSLESKGIVFVPACLLCPFLQAKKENDNYQWGKDIRLYLIENDISIMQMPCPETYYNSNVCGIQRKPHGVAFYEKLEGFSEYAKDLSQQVVDNIQILINGGCTVNAILGVENSPTCATSYIFTYGRGNEKRKGIYMQFLSEKLKERNMDIELIGINKRFPQKTIKKLGDILNVEARIDYKKHSE